MMRRMSDQKKDRSDQNDNPSAVLQATLPTSRHVEMFFDAVCTQLGPRAYVTTAAGGLCRWLFARDPHDPSFLVPWPLLKLRLGKSAERGIIELPGFPAAAPPAPPKGAPPKLRGLQRADLRICDGPDSVEVYCGEDGRACEWLVGTHGRPRPRALQPLEDGPGSGVERLAARVAAFDPERLGPARVVLPIPVPTGPETTWHTARRALREALWADRLDREARWVAIDGIAGTAVGEAGTREAALAACRDACARQRIGAPPPPKEIELTPEMRERIESGELIYVRGPDPDLAWPEVRAADVPIALVPVPPRPEEPCTFGHWVALLGDSGEIAWAGKRRDEHGFTLVGGDLLARIDLAALDAQLDDADQRSNSRELLEQMQHPDVPPIECLMAHYTPSGSGAPWRISSTSGGRGFHAHGLDGDCLRSQVVRQRWMS